MYGIFTYIWVIFRANVGTYSIHGAYGYGITMNCNFTPEYKHLKSEGGPSCPKPGTRCFSMCRVNIDTFEIGQKLIGEVTLGLELHSILGWARNGNHLRFREVLRFFTLKNWIIIVVVVVIIIIIIIIIIMSTYQHTNIITIILSYDHYLNNKGHGIFLFFKLFVVFQSDAVSLAICCILEPKLLHFGANISHLHAHLAFGFWLWLHLAFGFYWVFVPHIFVWGSCFFLVHSRPPPPASYRPQASTHNFVTHNSLSHTTLSQTHNYGTWWFNGIL